jgi:type IV secretion system protein VirB4
MSALPRQAALRREASTLVRIPFVAHVSPNIVKTIYGDYVQVFRLGGASFECADDDQLNTWHARLNVLWRNIASPQVALWAHVIRRREVTDVVEGVTGFAGSLERKYRTRLAQQTLMVNEIYLSLVYRPTAGVAAGLASRFLKRTRPKGAAFELADARESCEKLRDTVRASLERHEPELLGVYFRDGRAYSGPLNLFSVAPG